MNLIVNTTSMVPIYEQIMESIKKMIASGELKSGDPLPSVRTLSKDLKISALTVKKAYDKLEEEGFTETIHGKGTYIKVFNPDLMKEEQLKELEGDLERVVEKAARYGIAVDELKEMLDMLNEV